MGLELVREAYVFQSRHRVKKDELRTAGGRVLTRHGLRQGPRAGHRSAYRSASLINFEGRVMRSDIGHDLVRMRGNKNAAAQKQL